MKFKSKKHTKSIIFILSIFLILFLFYLNNVLSNFLSKPHLTIENPKSYPIVGGNWTVRFSTKGKADLIVKAINGTSFGENFPDDLKFLELKCGNDILSPVLKDNSIIYPEFYCSKKGSFTVKVLTDGKHTLEFKFGDDVKYAFNQAGALQFNQTSSTNITGNASTIIQTEIDARLNFNADGLTWDITEASKGIVVELISYYNFTDTTNNKAFKDPSAQGSTPPAWSNNWGGTEATSTEYTNLQNSDDQYADCLATAKQLEPFWRFNFTINENINSIQWIYIIIEGYGIYGGGEGAECYIANFGTQTWDSFASLTTSDAVYTQNYTSGFSNYIDSNKQLVLSCQGKNVDSGEGVRIDFVEVRVAYTTTIYTYSLSVEHNTTISYPGVLNSINVSINFTSTASKIFNMSIYDFANSLWDSSPCQSISVNANNYYTIWCNVTTNPTNYVSSDNKVRVRLNSTANSNQATLKEEFVQFYIGYNIVYLEVSLLQPNPSVITNVLQNSTFIVNTSVTCRGGDCGYVNGTVRYNSSSLYPDTPISTTFGDKPFFIQESPALATKECPNNPLSDGETCYLNWTINATGNINSEWKIGVLFNSSYSYVESNHTDNATISILPCTVDFTLTFNSVSFGILNPNTYNNSALGNSNNEYNITVNPGSCNLNLYIKGTNLVNETYNSVIKVGNLSWSNISSNINDGYFRMNESYSLIKSNVPPNTNVTLWFWIDVPPVYAGYYNGTIYIEGVEYG